MSASRYFHTSNYLHVCIHMHRLVSAFSFPLSEKIGIEIRRIRARVFLRVIYSVQRYVSCAIDFAFKSRLLPWPTRALLSPVQCTCCRARPEAATNIYRYASIQPAQKCGQNLSSSVRGFFFFVFFLILALRMTDNPQQGSRRLWSDSSRNWEDRQYILALKVILAWENPHVQWNSILKTQQKNYIRPAKGHPISHTAEILTYLVWINTVFAETLVGLGFL